MLRPYMNKSGVSGVTAFEIKSDSIRVQFNGKSVYEYSHSSAGKEKVEKMKELALKGRGLSTYISQKVKSNYVKIERRER